MSKKMNLMITGAGGKMGQQILHLAEDFKQIKVTTLVDRKKPFESLPKVNASQVDCTIDFTLPEFFSDILDWSFKNKKPFVSGTTGITSQQQEKLAKVAQKIPILWSPNMSFGVAIFQKLIAAFKNTDEYFDFDIIEAHHKHKKDKPSGTALLLKNDLKKVIKKFNNEPHSVRGGGVIGVHQLLAMGEEEVITIEHLALSRKVFARGAIQAALWLQKQPAGLYTIQDVLSS